MSAHSSRLSNTISLIMFLPNKCSRNNGFPFHSSSILSLGKQDGATAYNCLPCDISGILYSVFMNRLTWRHSILCTVLRSTNQEVLIRSGGFQVAIQWSLSHYCTVALSVFISLFGTCMQIYNLEK